MTLPYFMIDHELYGLIECYNGDVISAATDFCQSCSEEQNIGAYFVKNLPAIAQRIVPLTHSRYYRVGRLA